MCKSLVLPSDSQQPMPAFLRHCNSRRLVGLLTRLDEKAETRRNGARGTAIGRKIKLTVIVREENDDVWPALGGGNAGQLPNQADQQQGNFQLYGEARNQHYAAQLPDAAPFGEQKNSRYWPARGETIHSTTPTEERMVQGLRQRRPQSSFNTYEPADNSSDFASYGVVCTRHSPSIRSISVEW